MEEQKYLFVFASILLAMFLIYVYVCDHKEEVDSDWIDAFIIAGLPKEEIEFITHDSDVWYHRGVNTCVSYGDFEDSCDYHLAVCSRGEPPHVKNGTREEQANAVVKAIKSGGEHPWCPIVYPGAM